MTTLQCSNDGQRAVISGNRSAKDIMVALLQAAFLLAVPRQVPGAIHHEYLPDDKLSAGEAETLIDHGTGSLSMHRGRCVFLFAMCSGPNQVVIDLITYEGAPVDDLVAKAERLLYEDERLAVNF